MTDQSTAKKGLSKSLNVSTTIVFMVLAILLSMGAWWRNIEGAKYVDKKKEDAALIQKVGKLLSLPDESPMIATVSNDDTFKNENFSEKAKAGDKLIVYLNADQAIFYRPSSNKVIMLLPVSAFVRSYK